MPYAIDDVLLIELKQEYLEQSVANTLFYKIIDIVGTAITNALLDLLIETIVDFITPAQNTGVDHVEQILDNLTDGVSQHIGIYSTAGEVATSNPAASFIASGLKKSVSSRVTRPGSIRFTGMREEDMVGNALDSPYITILNAVGNNLAGTIIINDQAGTVATFKPVIVGRTPLGAFDLLRVNGITAVGQPRLTTQSSRKPGR